MFKNYFKTAFRNLRRNKVYSFLNIFGLAIGIACAGLIFLWVENEVTYNDYFSNKELLYKVKDSQTYSGTTYTFDATPGPLGPSMKNDIPGIRNTARYAGDQLLFSLGNKTIYEQGAYADSSFLNMFDLQFLKGNATHAFDQLYSVVISDKMAEKFFNTTDVVGKTLKVNNSQDYVITGVFKKLPENVSVGFDWLIPFRVYANTQAWLQSWGNNGITTYVEIQPNANIAAINKQLYNYISLKSGDHSEGVAKMSIYPMSRWRLYDQFKDGKEVQGRIKFVHLFSLIAWIILLIACINFMNLSTARSEQRAKEVGVRKTLGAQRGRLLLQFIMESVLLSVISTIIAVFMMAIALPSFNALVGEQLALHLFSPLHIACLIGIALVCGLIAGSYPALFLSSFKPVAVLNGLKLKGVNSAGWVRKILVVIQFSVSIILIISTLIIYLQINHVKNRDLGYNRHDLVFTTVQGNMVEHFDAIRNDLVQTGYVQNACLSDHEILKMYSNGGGWSWPDKDPNSQVLITFENASPQYVPTMGLHILEGRNFYPDMKADSSKVLINESFAKIIGAKNIIGTVISSGGGNKYTIVGVIKNFLYNNMYSAPAPLIVFSDTSYSSYLTIRFKHDANLFAAVAKTKAVIKKDNPGYPVEINFVDADFNNLFKMESMVGHLAGVFALLAILISCLGLFGLAAYTAERRTKEIGIRKVMGASVQRIVGLLSKDFLILIIISCIIAFPISWWMMHNWLQGYPYRITIHWWIFLIADVLAIKIALLTVIILAVRAAKANPVESLRAE